MHTTARGFRIRYHIVPAILTHVQKQTITSSTYSSIIAAANAPTKPMAPELIPCATAPAVTIGIEGVVALAGGVVVFLGGSDGGGVLTGGGVLIGGGGGTELVSKEHGAVTVTVTITVFSLH